ncbi:MAG: hypothetical protein IJC78_04290 [Clostridia bacterium]|nr:hypothetical protein [Clostridia bacterium]
MYALPEGYNGKQVAFFDCSQTYPQEVFFQKEGVRKVDSPLGTYLETGMEPLGRFGYRFPLNHPEKPHMLVLRYPDDKRRHMLINDCFSYDLSTGVITGGEYPITGTVQTLYYVFFSRTKDMTLTVTSWGQDEPAAMLGFAVYELDALPEKHEMQPDMPTRKFGVQYEDPCGTLCDLGALSFATWSDNIIRYAHHTGQNMLVYPINWYSGPMFYCESQPAGLWRGLTLPDHSQYTITTTTPDDWVSPFLDKCEQANIDFVGGMTLLRLGNLLKNMNVDLDAIVKGKDTYNNMRCDNRVQKSCNDWTIEYNPINIENQIAEGREKWDVTNFTYAYGEEGDDFGGAPMFNPLHPEVQRQLIEYFEEIGERFGKKKAFKGVSVNVWHSTMLWFGSLRLGYDDYTTELFAKETGIAVPCDSTDPARFEKRYTYLTARNRELWISWRCEKIHDLICKLRDALRKGNPELNFYICVWNEPVKRSVFGQFNESMQYPVFLSETEYLREGGIDLSLFANDTGIAVSIEQNQHRDRGWDTRGANMPAEESRFFHDASYMDTSWSGELKKLSESGAFVMDSWNEVWGENIRMPYDEKKPAICEALKSFPYENLHYYEKSLKIADDGYWFHSQRQITSCYPVGRNYLEPYAHAIAETDALYLLRGGLYLDKAHTEVISEYTGVFTKLPACKFSDAKGTDDPVKVRYRCVSGRFYAYAVNREPYEVQVTIKLEKSCDIQDIKNNTVLTQSGNTVTLSLKPFGLQAVTAMGENSVASYEAPIPEAEWLKTEKLYWEQLAVLEQTDGVAGLVQIRQELSEAYENRKIAKLRHILKCYVSEKARQKRMF